MPSHSRQTCGGQSSLLKTMKHKRSLVLVLTVTPRLENSRGEGSLLLSHLSSSRPGASSWLCKHWVSDGAHGTDLNSGKGQGWFVLAMPEQQAPGWAVMRNKAWLGLHVSVPCSFRKGLAYLYMHTFIRAAVICKDSAS